MNTIAAIHPGIRTSTTSGSLRPALRSEWIKLRSIRSTPLLAGITFVVGAGMALVLGAVVKKDPYEHLPFTVANTLVVSTWLTTLFAVAAGILLFTSEVQHGTLAGTLTIRPSRRTLVTAKTAAAAMLGLALGVVGILGSLIGGLASGMDRGDVGGVGSRIGWALLLTTIAAVLGVGVGMIVRHSAGAITIVLVWATALENLLRGLLPASVSRFMPFNAAARLLQTRAATDTAETLAASLSNAQNAVLFGGFAAIAVATGAWVLGRKDV